MNWLPYHFVVIMILVAVVTVAPTAAPSESALDRQPSQEPANPLEQRVKKLETRIELLERIVFSTATLSTMQAKRQLEEAQIQFKNNRELQLRGLITQPELEQSRYRVEQARLALELSQAENRQNEMVGELDVLDAEQRLKQAQEQLRYSELLSTRGFATRTEVELDKRKVDIARQQLENAKIKLEAARKLEAIRDHGTVRENGTVRDNDER